MNLNEIRTMKDHHYHEWSPEWHTSLKGEDPRRWDSISQDYDLPKGVSIHQRDVWVSLVVGETWETTNLFLDNIKESAEIFKSPAIEGYRQKIAKIIFDEGIKQEEWGFNFLYDGLARYANTCFGKSESYYDIASEIMDHSIPLRWEQERTKKAEKEKKRLREVKDKIKQDQASNDKKIATNNDKEMKGLFQSFSPYIFPVMTTIVFMIIVSFIIRLPLDVAISLGYLDDLDSVIVWVLIYGYWSISAAISISQWFWGKVKPASKSKDG